MKPALAPPPQRDLARIVLAVLAIGALLISSIWILLPFLPSIVWATLIVVATWPMLRRAQQWCGGRRWLAVTAMTFVLVALFLVPIVVATVVLVENAGGAVDWIKATVDKLPSQPPQWVESLPLVGARIGTFWRELNAEGTDRLAARIAPHTQQIAAWFAAQVGHLGVLVFQLFVTFIFAAVFFAHGENFGSGLRQFARALAGQRGDEAVVLAAAATRAVAFGVVVTALIQSVVAGLGLLVAGVPAWGLLTAVMFLLSIAQIGAAPVVLLAAIWTYAQGNTGWAIGLGVWTLIVGSMDNVLRPILIGREAHLPILLVCAGVIGGLIAFGPIGLFVGPVVLTVTFTLLRAFMKRGPATA